MESSLLDAQVRLERQKFDLGRGIDLPEGQAFLLALLGQYFGFAIWPLLYRLGGLGNAA